MLLLIGSDEEIMAVVVMRGAIRTEKLARIARNEQKEEIFFVKNKKKVEESGGKWRKMYNFVDVFYY